MKLIEKFLKTTFIICILCIILISCASKQSVKTTEEFCKKNLNQIERNNFPKPTSPHEFLEGHDWLQLELNNGPWMEYLRIGHKVSSPKIIAPTFAENMSPIIANN